MRSTEREERGREKKWRWEMMGGGEGEREGGERGREGGH
jgi:hypothetical protein